MQINKTVTALVLLSLAHIFVLTVAYSTFLQIPVVPNQNLMWQSLIEQFITWTPLIFVYYILFKGVTYNKKLNKHHFDENKFLIPVMLLIFLTGFGIGVHSVAQVFEDVLKTSTDTFLYSLSYFLDEYVGHLPSIFLSILSFFLVTMEINRKETKLSKIDNILTTTAGIINGFFWGVIVVEGGSMYLFVIPVVVGFLIYLKRFVQRHKLDVNELPYTKHFLIAAVVMIIFSLIWILSNGMFVQPDDLGIEIFKGLI